MIFPDGYTPAIPDAELVLIDMVQPLLDALDPAGVVGTWWPSDAPNDTATLVNAGKAVVRVHKLPGVVELDGKLHVTELTTEVLSSTRATSWSVMQYLQDRLTFDYEFGGVVPRSDGSKTALKSFGISATGQQLDFLNPDDRLVQETFQLVFKRNLRK